MKFRLARHARQELTRRRVPRVLLNKVLEQPEQIVPERGGRKAYKARLDFGGGKIFLLRAIVDDRTAPATVVTVYHTSKIDKYWSKQS